MSARGLGRHLGSGFPTGPPSYFHYSLGDSRLSPAPQDTYSGHQGGRQQGPDHQKWGEDDKKPEGPPPRASKPHSLICTSGSFEGWEYHLPRPIQTLKSASRAAASPYSYIRLPGTKSSGGPSTQHLFKAKSSLTINPNLPPQDSNLVL